MWLYRQLTERLYHEWSPLYDATAWLVSFGQWDAWRRSSLEFVQGSCVLELGSGTGRLLPHLSHISNMVIAVEPSSHMVVRTAKGVRATGSKTIVVQARAQQLPLRDESVDTIVCTFPTEYVLDPQTIVACRHVLRSGKNCYGSSRFVITGLWVDTDIRILRWLGVVFYGRANMVFLARYLAAFRQAGYSPAVLEQRIGSFRIGTLIAIKLQN